MIRDGYPLLQYPRIGEGDVTQTPVTDPLGTASQYLWQEYLPASVLDAAQGTVPLLITIHGSTDMPQHIAERSGWVEQIAEVGAIMVSVENQGSRFGFANFDGPATERLVALLTEKYPQIDRSRVYATGFSIGGSSSQSWGIASPRLFTAVSGVAAPFGGGDSQIAQAVAAAKPNQEVPFYMLQGVDDGLRPLPVSASSRSVYSTIRAYGALNGLNVPVTPDLALNPHYGIALDDQAMVTMGTNEALVGTLSNDRGVVLKLAAVSGLGHVSFAPSAADIWEFFSGYRRDVATGELFFVQSADIDVKVSIPDDGGLSLTVSDSVIDLGEAELTSDLKQLAAGGDLPVITVTDLRLANPGWTATAHSTDFVSGTNRIEGETLGLAPALLSSSPGQSVVAGPTVDPGVGFLSGMTLATTAPGAGRGTAELSGRLELRAPTTTLPGDDLSKLTVTVY